jgi:hypothetical protein
MRSAMPPCPTEPGGNADALLDAIGLLEAALRHDEAASTVLLDGGDNRRQASLLAEITAHIMTAAYPDPLRLLARMRPVLLAADRSG